MNIVDIVAKLQSRKMDLVFRSVDFVIGAVVVLASLLKVAELRGAKEIDSRVGLIMVVVAVEFAFGLSIVVGLRSAYKNLVGTVLFSIFLAIALYRATIGEQSCGCFGAVNVNPWHTVIFDAGSLLVFAATGRISHRPVRPNIGRVRLSVLCVAATVMLAWTFPVLSRIAGIAPTDDFAVSNGVTVLDPERWKYKQFPLIQYIDIGDKFTSGRWVVVLYRWDCEHCQRALPRYEALAKERTQHPDQPAIALVEVPPYASPGHRLTTPDSGALLGQLSDSREWFVETPMVIELDAGRVISAVAGERAEFPSKSISGL